MPLLDGLKVVRSSIHGYGVIATRRFSEGDVVCVGDGVLYREDDDFDDTYSLILPGYEPDPVTGAEGPPMFFDLVCQTRWINHACDPNTYVDTGWDEATGSARAWWVAVRTIEPGEELSYDYEFAAEVAEPCACGMAKCRGVIVDPNDAHNLKPSLRARLR
ncbi:MAG: SET domain-containing protein-lysine N-methyltransferase [Kofleriaceae bacterium]